MYEISDTVYRGTASRLLTAIEKVEYFNGSIQMEYEDFRATLRSTLIIYREEVTEQGDEWSRMVDIVPVWWEFETCGACGCALNDFSWNRFREYLL